MDVDQIAGSFVMEVGFRQTWPFLGLRDNRPTPALERHSPIDASSGDQNRHLLSRAGNRRINRALHIMAVVQLRNDTEGRRYYRREHAEGKTPNGSDARPETTAVRRRLPADDRRHQTPLNTKECPVGEPPSRRELSGRSGWFSEALAVECRET